MQEKAKYDILSLNVRGIRDQAKRRSIFLYLKDHNSKIYFLQETYSQPEDEIIWKNEWGGEIFFSHGSRHSKGVCILLHPTVQNKIDYSFSDKAGRIVLITCVLNSLKLSLVNIYAPNSQSEQLDFLQNLKNCLIDKSEISTLIVGGDWNCTLSKIDKIGGTIWKPTNYRNLILTTMDAFDLVDIQRLRHPRLRKYSYESKVLKLKSRIDFFLVAKNLTQHVKKSEIYPSIAPDHRAIYISLSWTTEKSRGPGLWKFNNTLLKDEHYASKIRETYSRTRAFYSNLTDARLLWEMLKMEIRATTIAYSKKKAKATTNRELEIRKAFDSLEWSFMMKALDIFNFGTSIKRWISTFYTKIESAAINNGFMTNWFRPSRGVRQGCPLSPYLFVLSTEILSSKIRQEPSITGIKIFGHEIKLSQFADDTNLFCADLISVENALKTVGDFGRLAGLKLNIKKSKAIWLGKWEKNKSYPLQLKWLHSPTRLLGIHVSYDEKGNNELNFNLKIRKLQTKLDMWRSRDLTLFGKVLIIKSLGLSQLIYSASILNVPEDIASTVKTKFFSFLWKNKRDKIKRTGLYQDLGRGGIRMVDIDIMFKALKLAWIPRLLTPGNQNWKTVPDYYLRKFGGLNFLLRCNYDAKYIKSIPLFYRNILVYFSELKTLYSFDQAQNIILFNNKEILVDSKTFFIREWFKKGILSIQDLLNNTGQPMTYQEFTNKYSCITNFLQYYQVISAIPKHLLAKAKSTKPINKELYSDNNLSLQLNESITLYLNKIKTSDFYTLLCTKIHTTGHSGPQRWSKDLSLDEDKWEKIFTSLKTVCRETKLKEFQYKLIHRIVVTKKELYRYGIKEDDECIYCGEKDSINHTFRDCHFVKIFIQRVINWFNIENKINLNPSSEERLFGILSDLHEKVLVRKFNYTMLFMRYYIYANKLHNKPILLQDFVGKMIIKYRIEKL